LTAVSLLTLSATHNTCQSRRHLVNTVGCLWTERRGAPVQCQPGFSRIKPKCCVDGHSTETLELPAAGSRRCSYRLAVSLHAALPSHSSTLCTEQPHLRLAPIAASRRLTLVHVCRALLCTTILTAVHSLQAGTLGRVS
jgi:hypothetical protein